MPYLSFVTVTGQQVELSGNDSAAFNKAFEKHGNIAALPEAQAYVALFFERRKTAIDRQKALQVGDENKADQLDDIIEQLEAKELAAKEAYAKAASRGPSATSAASSAPTAAPAAKSGNAYADAFKKAPKTRVEEDDFM